MASTPPPKSKATLPAGAPAIEDYVDSNLTDFQKEQLKQGFVPNDRARLILEYNQKYGTKYDPDNLRGFSVKAPEGGRRRRKMTRRGRGRIHNKKTLRRRSSSRFRRSRSSL